MYVPRHFSNEHLPSLHQVIVEHALGTLVTSADGHLEATHVPCVLDANDGANGRLRFHLAAANPTTKLLDSADEVLLVFSGPEHYISPDWYTDKHLVPTWNYVAVHVHGRATRMDDTGLCALLDDLSAASEALLPKRPWTTDKVPDEMYAKMRRAIVGFELPITTIQGKWKLSQNRAAADVEGAVTNLRALNKAQALAVAMAMEQAGGTRK